MIFKKSKNGLYYFDLNKKELNMLQTVEENKNNYSERAYQRAIQARKLYHLIGTPSLKDYKTIIQSNIIKIVQQQLMT